MECKWNVVVKASPSCCCSTQHQRCILCRWPLLPSSSHFSRWDSWLSGGPASPNPQPVFRDPRTSKSPSIIKIIKHYQCIIRLSTELQVHWVDKNPQICGAGTATPYLRTCGTSHPSTSLKSLASHSPYMPLLCMRLVPCFTARRGMSSWLPNSKSINHNKSMRDSGGHLQCQLHSSSPPSSSWMPPEVYQVQTCPNQEKAAPKTKAHGKWAEGPKDAKDPKETKGAKVQGFKKIQKGGWMFMLFMGPLQTNPNDTQKTWRMWRDVFSLVL